MGELLKGNFSGLDCKGLKIYCLHSHLIFRCFRSGCAGEATLELMIGLDDVRRGLAGKPVFLRLLGGPAGRLLTGEPLQQHNR